MSILIRGMEMPKEGEWISVNIFHDGKCFVQSWCGKDFNFAAKLTAVPVPPHGGLKKHDVRPVVLCRDCKHRPARKDGRIRAPEDADGYTDYKCPFVCDDSWYNRMPADDDYCSHGEKREES